jgi:prepilin-type processing-associated H-X9-DG protein
MYCPKCGTENSDGVQLCRSCSWVLGSASTVGIAPDAKTSKLAVTALVLAILSPFTFCITVIPAVIFGIVGLLKIEKSAGRLKGKGLAIAGIAASGAIIPFALMMGILMPALAKVRASARQVTCAINLKQIGVMVQLYAADNDKRYPAADKWCDALKPYCGSGRRMFCCPSTQKKLCYYAVSPNAEPNSPPDMVLLFETNKNVENQYGGPEILSTDNHRGKGCNILFNDLHAEFVKTEDLKKLKWAAEQKN